MKPIQAIIRTYHHHQSPWSSQRIDWAFSLQSELQDLLPIVSIDTQGDAYEHFLMVLQNYNHFDVQGFLHVEDDAILCDHFIERMRAEVRAHPDTIIQFYSRFKDDVQNTSRWHQRFVGGVCFYLPIRFHRPLYDYLTTWKRRRDNPTAWDIGMRDWMQEANLAYWLVLPNLADHRVSPSVVDVTRPEDRRSYTFQG